MKNRPKPGTRSYAANGGEVVKSNSPKDGHRDTKTVAPLPEAVNPLADDLEISAAEVAKLQAEAEMSKAELDAAVKANTALKTQVKVLKADANKAEIVLVEKKQGTE